MSWDEAFAVGYEEWSAHMPEDIAFYVELALEADGPLVELAVGNGRVAVPVARATGQRVVGLDVSPAMLDQARARADDAGVELDLREADMRDLRLDEPAALVYCPFRALLHLTTWAIATLYAELVSDMLKTRPMERAMPAAFAELVQAHNAGPVADIGCGPGHVTAHLHALAYRWSPDSQLLVRKPQQP
ncbi:methyltransferase domain-containing protein [Saccharothrix sp. ALI-22-I]|uniref:methyltransferase domain-containing protein n=1 Tax=Saccharothrix sp. ALI-22-I TaxID=1933778 RepID=UPI00193114A2